MRSWGGATVTRRPPYQAQLRVYEPVDQLPMQDRERWQRYAVDAPSAAEVEAELYLDSIRRLAGRPPVLASESRHAMFLQDGGQTFVCPQQPRLAMWRRLEGRDGAGELEGELLPWGAVPQALREQASADLTTFAVAGGEVRLYTRTSAWLVPIAWFVPFEAGQRHEGDRSRGGVTYRATMAQARRRMARALKAVRATLGDLPLVDDVELVACWLEEFHPHSRVELDYGGLAALMNSPGLHRDDSVSDVSEGLAALAEGDATTAAAAYRRWTTRWQRVQLYARSS